MPAIFGFRFMKMGKSLQALDGSDSIAMMVN